MWKFLSNSYANFNFENVNLLSNPTLTQKMELLIKKNVYASKPNFPVVFQKKKLKLCICVWTSMTWLRALESTLPFKTASRNSWEAARLSKILCDNASLSNNLVITLCHQSFLLHCFSLTYWKLLPFLESILFFFLWF